MYDNSFIYYNIYQMVKLTLRNIFKARLEKTIKTRETNHPIYRHLNIIVHLQWMYVYIQKTKVKKIQIRIAYRE
jgi:hypothetical protein